VHERCALPGCGAHLTPRHQGHDSSARTDLRLARPRLAAGTLAYGSWRQRHWRAPHLAALDFRQPRAQHHWPGRVGQNLVSETGKRQRELELDGSIEWGGPPGSRPGLRRTLQFAGPRQLREMKTDLSFAIPPYEPGTRRRPPVPGLRAARSI